jgi:hypothetical protein
MFQITNQFTMVYSLSAKDLGLLDCWDCAISFTFVKCGCVANIVWNIHYPQQLANQVFAQGCSGYFTFGWRDCKPLGWASQLLKLKWNKNIWNYQPVCLWLKLVVPVAQFGNFAFCCVWPYPMWSHVIPGIEIWAIAIYCHNANLGITVTSHLTRDLDRQWIRWPQGWNK